jgi:hypothetical protein
MPALTRWATWRVVVEVGVDADPDGLGGFGHQLHCRLEALFLFCFFSLFAFKLRWVEVMCHVQHV